MSAPQTTALPFSDVRHGRAKLAFQRAGFSLIELLVAISIIGILVGLLVPAVQAVRKSVGTVAIATEVAQMEGSIEVFKSEYGFYPSDFSEFVNEFGVALDWNDTIPGTFGGITTVGDRLFQLVNNIAPANNESAAEPLDGTQSRLQYWWNTVGMNLAVYTAGAAGNREARLRGPQVAAWFWLSQLYNDGQYPISGPRDFADVDGDLNVDEILPGAERKLFHDFKKLEVIQTVVYPALDGSMEYPIARGLDPGGVSPILYFHNRTYLNPFRLDLTDLTLTTVVDFEPGVTNPPNLGMPARIPGSALADGLFLEDKKFQLVSGGYDEQFGDLEDADVSENRDNVCNFSEGRLDAFVNEYEGN